MVRIQRHYVAVLRSNCGCYCAAIICQNRRDGAYINNRQSPDQLGDQKLYLDCIQIELIIESLICPTSLHPSNLLNKVDID
jgi:hypothetical protein